MLWIQLTPGKNKEQDMTVLGRYLEDVVKLNAANKNFRIFGPDETMSNRFSPTLQRNKPSMDVRYQRT